MAFDLDTDRSEFALQARPDARATGIDAKLRLLATTDIHMSLLGFDYVSNSGTGNHGLAGIATLIEQARSEARDQGRTCVLFDNGDVLQGSALGNWLAQNPVTDSHPIVAGFNHLQYDAVGIGNHDLDHGLPYLRQVAAHLKMPVLRSNLHATDLNPLQDHALIDCELAVEGKDTTVSLRIGVLSVLPADTAIWNRAALEGEAEVENALHCLRRSVPALREKGADLVVLLAHMGIGGVQDGEKANESVLALAQVPGIDAIITGHTHRRFPGLDHRGMSDVDTVTGTVAKRPAIMPGFAGSDLAVLDLSLHRDAEGRWRVANHAGCLRPNTSRTPANHAITALTMPAHLATLDQLSEKVGHSKTPLHNYFSLAMPTPTAALMARAKAHVVRHNLRGTALGELPLLVATAAHTSGGRGGPGNYLHIPAGTIYRRHVVGLNPYANNIRALEITGADLRRHLERSALVYNRLHPDAPDQLLIDPAFPAFNFDTIYGLDYRIDPTRAPGHRITGITCDGAPVHSDSRFVLVTNQFRAAGGGGFDTFDKQEIALPTESSIEDALMKTFARGDEPGIWADVHAPWRFDCARQIRATLLTSPNAFAMLDDVAHLSPEWGGITEAGFAKITLSL